MSMPQLPLSLTPPRRKRLDNFIPGPNVSLVSSLRHSLEECGSVFLRGPEGSGKTHLALGLLAERSTVGQRACYVPCRDRGAAELLAVGDTTLAVVDDIDALAGRDQAELAFFNALNRWKHARTAVLMTGCGALPFNLPDLVSRVSQAAHLTLKPLDDDGLMQLIRQLITDFDVVPGRGLAEYLLRHGPRSAGGLSSLFERLSRRAQAERRVVSVPLVRETLKAF